MTKPIVKYKNLLKNIDLLTVYQLAYYALIDSDNEKQLKKMIEHMKTSKSNAETKDNSDVCNV